MASEQELESLHIIELAVLCQRAADNPALDNDTRASAAALELEWVQLVQRETPPPPDFKTVQKIEQDKAELSTRMVKLLATI
jgi:hypothetical protein